MMKKESSLNEAETRFMFIDRFIVECLGWPRELFKLERPYQGTYTDYELGQPCLVVWEAKKEGINFELPAGTSKRLIQHIDAICKLSKEAEAAMSQVQRYAGDRGIPYAVVSNSHQLIAFLASRQDGIPPLKGNCIAIDGYEALLQHFPMLWQVLSPDGIEERRLTAALKGTEIAGVPAKLSTHIQYPRIRYPSESQQSLRILSELLIEDAPNTPAIEQQFYENCYCESGALSKEALVSREILKARYAALFDPQEAGSTPQPVVDKTGEATVFSSEVIAEALGRRPIALVGDVGVGKTSFLKHLYYVRAPELFKASIFLHVDLGINVLFDSLKDYFLREIERGLLANYELDIYESSFVRGVHFDVVQRFEHGINKYLKDANPAEYDRKLVEALERAIDDKVEHLRKCVSHISKGRRQQVVIAIDNTDQRDLNTQQEAFLIAQDLAQNWNALVFIALRPSTFHQSKRSGTLSAYPLRALTIAPPRVDLVLERRLVFAVDMAEGRLPIEKLQNVTLRLDAIALVLKALLLSLQTNKELVEFLSNITGGNIRQVIDLIKRFIGSPNVESDKIISIMREGKGYRIPLHEFTKAALLGEYAHYEPASSIALNVFDVRFPDPREHFLGLAILAYLGYDSPARNQEGFIALERLIGEMQSFGFTPEQAENALRRLTNKKLIETTHRITFDEGLEALVGGMPGAFRVTTIGAYHHQKWATSFPYLDAMVFDTPIFDRDVRDLVARGAESFEIKVRYQRAIAFRDYLTKVWDESPLKCPYFDWQTLLLNGHVSFERLERVLR